MDLRRSLGTQEGAANQISSLFPKGGDEDFHGGIKLAVGARGAYFPTAWTIMFISG
jgi:hypothetical protein